MKSVQSASSYSVPQSSIHSYQSHRTFIKETRNEELLQNKQKKCLTQLFTHPYPADKINERDTNATECKHYYSCKVKGFEMREQHFLMC